MNEKQKKAYLEEYKKDKEKGVPFFPDIIFKDAVISLVVFLVLVALVFFVGAPLEARANPNDTNYTPRPEWYFLFLFQLLKYFPGNLEVIGAMILPGLFIVLLILLPFLDKSAKRHPLNRPFASIAAIVVVAGIGGLTLLSVLEAPPPQQAVVVDQAAALYAENCANCHGPSMTITPGIDLHAIIAGGTHEGMPAWGGDLSTDEIDLLVGFILSPNGSALYTQQCETCHEQGLLSSGNPLELQRVFAEGPDYPDHQGLNIPDWNTVLTAEQRDALLNFLAAPDGERLFAINCAGCHGQGVAFVGSQEELRTLIAQGGHDLAMPAWKGTLNETDLNILANYISDPKSETSGPTLFGKYCAACHNRVPAAPDAETARRIISSGGPHVTMPIWGDVLTDEQLNALAEYTYAASQGIGPAAGQLLFAQYCVACHGQFGQGGPNPFQAGDIIPPISLAEYLKTRDDATLRSIIAQGQPSMGMSPFGDAYGGPLTDTQVDALVSFIRSWEANPPISEPPTYDTGAAPTQPVAGGTGASGGEVTFSATVMPILSARCQACHSSALKMGGWQITSYDTVITGDNGPVVIPGDPDNSKLVQRLHGINGGLMPPSGKLPDSEIQIIIDWITAGALDN